MEREELALLGRTNRSLAAWSLEQNEVGRAPHRVMFCGIAQWEGQRCVAFNPLARDLNLPQWHSTNGHPIAV
jgi:hypothetical protein